MSEQTTPRFAVECPDCDVEQTANDANEIIAFYERHRRLTNHEVTWTRTDLGFDDIPSDGDLKTVVRALEKHFDDGVPVGIIAAARAKQGVTMSETMDELYELRMTGGLYEPKDDHLAAF